VSIKARSVVANVLYNYTGLLVSTAVGFGLTPILVDHLGHRTFGAYVLIGTMIGYTALLDFGVGVTVMRLVAGHMEDEDPTRVRSIVSNGVALYTLLGLVVLGVAAGVYPFVGGIFDIHGAALHSFRTAFAISMVTMGLTFPSAVFTGILQGFHNFRASNVVAVCQCAVGAIGALVVVERGGGLVPLALVNAAVALGAFAVKATYARRRYRVGFRWSLIRRAELSRIVRISSWLLIGNLAVMIVFDVDNLVVGAVLGVGAVAAFAVTLGAANALQGLGNAMNSVTLSTASSLVAREDRAGLQRILLQSVRITLVVLGPFTVLAALWGSQLLRLWVGPTFESSAPTLFVMALGTTIALVQAAASQVIIACGRQRRLFLITVPEAAVNLALSIALARHLGIVGVALGTALPTTITTFGVVLPYACRLTGTHLSALGRRLLLPLAVPAGLFAVLRLPALRVHFTALASLALAGIGVTVASYLLNLVLDPSERQTYRALIPGPSRGLHVRGRSRQWERSPRG
jgi:O-antigen/teichoic acid export membrane protein